MEDAFNLLALILKLLVVLVIGFACLFTYDHIGQRKIESKVIVKPDFKLETNGKTIDTIYIYTFK